MDGCATAEASQTLQDCTSSELTWQYTRGSALIGFIKDDAEFIAEQIAALQEPKVPESARTPAGAGAPADARSSERV